jgi:hypothetical protein
LDHQTGPPGCNVLVYGCDPTTLPEEKCKKIFDSFGGMVCMRNMTACGKSYFFVGYETTEQARNVILKGNQVGIDGDTTGLENGVPLGKECLRVILKMGEEMHNPEAAKLSQDTLMRRGLSAADALANTTPMQIADGKA